MRSITINGTTRLHFRPHPLFLGGHLQTLAGFYWPAPATRYRARLLFVDVSHGDQIALHDDCPETWRPDSKTALLVHGLAGCHGSGYMIRAAQRLNEAGVRTFRMDMRGTGAGVGKSRQVGHAGRTQDVCAAIRTIAEMCPDSPLTAIGYSMGGNVVLGAAACASESPVGHLVHCIAVCPPVDLSRCCRELRQGTSRFYDKYLIGHLRNRWREAGGSLPSRPPRSIYEFDDRITAPLSGFQDAEDYYAQSSSGPRLRDITLPTRILAAQDDPLVSFEAIESAQRSDDVRLFVTETGGHLGFFSQRRDAADRRWMDRTIVDWVVNW